MLEVEHGFQSSFVGALSGDCVPVYTFEQVYGIQAAVGILGVVCVVCSYYVSAMSVQAFSFILQWQFLPISDFDS